MNVIAREIFKAIHENKWLSIEYHNKNGMDTRYWIGIHSIDPITRRLVVDGMHLRQYSITRLNIIVDSITSALVIEGSYYETDQGLIRDIQENPDKYQPLFCNVANLKILSYLEMCNRLDSTPYTKDIALIKYLDQDILKGVDRSLSDEQFRNIVKNFQNDPKHVQNDSGIKLKQLAMNVLSIHTQKGLYVLAYRRLSLDVKKRILRQDDEITICTEFTLDGTKESIRKYLDADDYELLDEFNKNQEKIKDIISRKSQYVMAVDDMPYIIGIGRDIALDLHSEYQGIIKMFDEGKQTIPLKAFFGELTARPRRSGAVPIVLQDQRVNLDQLLAINNAMQYPVAYIQGPPGTGKTSTIINTIVTAFFNERTVLFSSYNNHPLESVFTKLTQMKYHERTIPFPVLRIGNHGVMKQALRYMKTLRQKAAEIEVFQSTLEKNKKERTENAKKLSDLLKKYDELVDLRERQETLHCLIDYEQKEANDMHLLPFVENLGSHQLRNVERMIKSRGSITNEDALKLLDHNADELGKYLYYTSASYIKRIEGERYTALREILEMSNEEKQCEEFTRFLKKKENIKELQQIFPIIISTCISAHKIGVPEPVFNMVIMDEASQCNTAISLVTIIRGEKLMLVGDPQQLNPVVLLNEKDNEILRKKYGVSEEYDYRKGSVYKTYLACDPVSDEVLLHEHYRCNEKIIGFNNKKYYNSKLEVKSQSKEQEPLLFVDVKTGNSDKKNTSVEEAGRILKYAALHKDQSIGVITPFVNQKELLEKQLEENDLHNVAVGTVHSFQGDEKDVILFSTAITGNTQKATYGWLKDNKELLNVATSRAREKLIILADLDKVNEMHQQTDADDLFELIQYVRSNGRTEVTPKETMSRALGIKPFSTATEEAFLQSLTTAMSNIMQTRNRYVIHKEVPIAQAFLDNTVKSHLFYSGRFDFVIYEATDRGEYPLLVIELDGKEHLEDEVVRRRDMEKEKICHEHNMQLIRVESSYARRYSHIKEILERYFSRA